MPACCHVTRRQVLQWGALVAATPFLSALADPERAYGVSGSSRAVPINLELVTVTETSAVLTWFTGDPTRPDRMGRPAPVPADTEVLLGPSPAALRTVLHDTSPTPYHYAELTGLEPGRPYYYQARSGGVPAAPSVFFAGDPVGTGGGLPPLPSTFTTPLPPPGRHLFSIALCNDLHLGETVAGLITGAGGGIPPGVMQLPGRPPYSQVMAEALATEAPLRGAQLILAAGDISSEAATLDLTHAKSYLDLFGPYRSAYFVARGNHDRPHQGDVYTHCHAMPGAPGYHDCFRDTFFPHGPTWFETTFHGLRIVGLDTYDKIGSGGDNGVLSAAQFAFVRDTLGADKDRPTIVFGHHPVTLESTLTTTEPVLFDLNPEQGIELSKLYAATPGVFLHHSGHTHRNKRSSTPFAPGVVFQEVSATKEYPGGFHLLRVHAGGFGMNFYKFRSPLAREWSERTRQEDFGGYPYYTVGAFGDRNYTVARDLSGLGTPATGAAPTTAPLPPPAPGAGPPLPVTGIDPRYPIAGTAALAAGVAAAAWVRARDRSAPVDE